MTLVIILVVLALLALYAVSIYNRLVSNRNLVKEGGAASMCSCGGAPTSSPT